MGSEHGLSMLQHCLEWHMFTCLLGILENVREGGKSWWMSAENFCGESFLSLTSSLGQC